MKKRWKQIISAVLVSVMMAGILPMEAVASEWKTSDTYTQTALERTMPEEKKEEPLKTIGEIEAKREANVKHFRLEDGGTAAAMYEYPVHYQDERGSWNEIDNSLEKKEAGYENRESPVQVRFAESSSQEDLVRIGSNGSVISWSLKADGSAKSRSAAGSLFEVLGQDENRGRSAVPEDNRASEEMGVSKALSQGIYRDIEANVDLEYSIMGNTVKENIILKEAGCTNSYTFTLRHPGLEARKEADGSLTLAKAETPEQVEFLFPAPFAYDAAGEMTQNASFTLSPVGEGETELTLSVDKEWLESKEREYPVVIDPYTETEPAASSISDAYVSQQRADIPGLNLHGSFYVGYNSVVRNCRTFLRFNKLPTLGKGDLIYQGYLDIAQYWYQSNIGNSFNMAAYEVKDGWNESTLVWNNMPAYSQNALDYTQAQAMPENQVQFRRFDITKLVRQWYNTGVNNGVMLKSMNEDQTALAQFFTSNYPFNTPGNYTGGPELYPSGILCYRNASGLEDYWSYHEQDCGTAGTGYTNDYNGNLTMIHDDASTSDSILPASVSHVYNMTESDTNSRFGYGWRLNVMQRFEPTSGKLAENFPYVYTDADGTKHYFYNDNGAYKDEDGLGLTYSLLNSNNDEYYQLTLKDKSKLVFDIWGYLRRVIDPKGNVIRYNYGPNANGNVLGNIVDAAGKVIHLQYNEDHSKLTSIIDQAGRTTRYEYDAWGNLQFIRYPDGLQTRYWYDGHTMLAAESCDESAVLYSYTNDMRVPRVSAVKEKGTDGTIGQEMEISYANGCRTMFKDVGLNQTITYNFDTMGRMHDVQDAFNNAVSSQYYTGGANSNQLSEESGLNQTTENLIRNGCVEAHRDDTWYSFQEGSDAYYEAGAGVNEGYSDKKSMRIYKTGKTGNTAVAQAVYCEPGDYTLSAYVKVRNMADDTGKKAGAGLRIKINEASEDAPYVLGQSEYLTNTNPAIENGWQRVSLYFNVWKATWVEVMGGIFDTSGEALFDNFQLERGTKAGPVNLLNNGGFECGSGSGRSPYAWPITTSDSESAYITGGTKFGQGSLKLKGTLGQQCRTAQAVNVAGDEGDTFVLSGWAQGETIPKGTYRIAAAVIYENHDPIWHEYDFDTSITDWQYGSTVFSTDDNDSSTNLKYTAIHVYIFFDNTLNSVQFDGLQLLKDDSQSYVYDKEGNLVTAKSAAEKNAFSYDKAGNLSKMVDAKGSSYEYAYTGNGNLELAKGSDGVSYKFAYDNRGNPVKSQSYGKPGQTVIVAGQEYYLRNGSSGKYMSALGGGDYNGANVGQYELCYAPDQKWRVEDVGGGYYTLVNVHSSNGRVLDVQNSGTTDGTNLVIREQNKSQAQQFKLKLLGNGGYQLLPKHADGKLAVSNNGEMGNTANIDMRNAAEYGSQAQSWYFEPVPDRQTEKPEAGEVYMLRSSLSQKYISPVDNSSATGSRTVLYSFATEQGRQIRLQDAGDGYFYFEPMNAGGKVLSAEGSHAVYGNTVISLQVKNIFDNRQKFKFELNNGEYNIVSKENGQYLEAAMGYFGEGTSVWTASGNGTEAKKRWSLEKGATADSNGLLHSSQPGSGKVYNMYSRLTGQYLTPLSWGNTADTRMVQEYYQGGHAQQYRLESAGDDYYYIVPIHAQGMVLSAQGNHAVYGNTIISLQPKADDDRQKFRFVRSGKAYNIVNKATGKYVEVAMGYNTTGTTIWTDSGNAAEQKKLWVLEEASESLNADIAYTPDGTQVSKVTDTRGNETKYTYDASNRLMTSASADPEDKSRVNYEYNQSNDQLTKVSGNSAAGNNISNSYRYDKERMTGITHNGFTYSFGYDAFGNMSTTNVGNRKLSENFYDYRKGQLTSTTFGNQQRIRSEYDQQGNLIKQYGANRFEPEFRYGYDARNRVVEKVRALHGEIGPQETTTYAYDQSDRLLRARSDFGQSLEWSYDAGNRLTGVTNSVFDKVFKTQYVYGVPVLRQSPDMIYQLNMNGKTMVNYSYDNLSRLKERTLNTAEPFITKYQYLAARGGTTALLNRVDNGSNSLLYNYDRYGNVSQVTENNALRYAYTYGLNQELLTAKDYSRLTEDSYGYDNGGNLLFKEKRAIDPATGAAGDVLERMEYGYADGEWKDLMTSYNGQPITYDEIGNPITYRDGMWFQWTNGRQLFGADIGDKELKFKYDDAGVRREKIVNDVTTQFFVDGSSIMSQVTGEQRLDFFYDEASQLIGFQKDGTDYYYIRDGLMNITGILDKNGRQVVSYTYDPWGKLLDVSGSLADTIGQENPFRYKGYYYDSETSLYYLNSRYYDAETGRFLNADDTSILQDEQGSLLQHNLFAYGLNNPIMNADYDGEIAISAIIGGVVGGVTGAALGIVLAKQLGLTGWKKAALISAATVGGAVLGAFLGPYVAKLARVATTALKAGVKATAKTAVRQTVKMSANNVWKRSSGHIFSKAHIKDGIMRLGGSQRSIFNKLTKVVNSNLSNAVNGSNQIHTTINGVKTTIRFYVSNGQVQSMDAFTGWASRIIGKLL